jgi:hypothetical protein
MFISNPRFRLLYFAALLAALKDDKPCRAFTPLSVRICGIYLAGTEHGVFMLAE